MSMLIRYEGFISAATNRFYNFSVSGPAEGPRQFTVGISFESIDSAQLKFQDGPSISFQRIKEELDQEVQDSPAKTQLTINKHDIESYLSAQQPEAAKKKCLPSYSAHIGSDAIHPAIAPNPGRGRWLSVRSNP